MLFQWYLKQRRNKCVCSKSTVMNLNPYDITFYPPGHILPDVFFIFYTLSYLISCVLNLYSNILDMMLFHKKICVIRGDVFSNVLLSIYQEQQDENRKIKDILRLLSKSKISKKIKLLKEKINYQHFSKILVRYSFSFLFIYFLYKRCIFQSLYLLAKNLFTKRKLTFLNITFSNEIKFESRSAVLKGLFVFLYFDFLES